jgi:hypothetical protein
MLLCPSSLLLKVMPSVDWNVIASGRTEYRGKSTGEEPFLGFYDWLRTPAGRLVGFRITVGVGKEDFGALDA